MDHPHARDAGNASEKRQPLVERIAESFYAKSFERRFWARVDKSAPGGCWLWTGDHQRHSGYGRLQVGGRIVRAHRVAYALLVGEVPDGLELDHLCRVRLCVNPAHLEPVTRQVNLLRGKTINARNAAKTHCPRGHLYTAENTKHFKQRNGGPGRTCRSCDKARKRLRG